MWEAVDDFSSAAYSYSIKAEEGTRYMENMLKNLQNARAQRSSINGVASHGRQNA